MALRGRIVQAVIVRVRLNWPGKLDWCGRPDLNRHGKLLPRDFKSLASTISPRPRERTDIAHPQRRTSITRPRDRPTGPRDGRSTSVARAHGTAPLFRYGLFFAVACGAGRMLPQGSTV